NCFCCWLSPLHPCRMHTKIRKVRLTIVGRWKNAERLESVSLDLPVQDIGIPDSQLIYATIKVARDARHRFVMGKKAGALQGGCSTRTDVWNNNEVATQVSLFVQPTMQLAKIFDMVK